MEWDEVGTRESRIEGAGGGITVDELRDGRSGWFYYAHEESGETS